MEDKVWLKRNSSHDLRNPKASSLRQALQGCRAAAMASRQVFPTSKRMPSLFHMDPFDMFRTSPFALMRRFMEDIEQQWGQPEMGRSGPGMAAAGSEFFSPPIEIL